MLKIEAFRMRRQKWNRIVRRLMSLFYPVLKITCTVIHFHTSNFIPPALRQFYSIAIFPLKSFFSFALSRSSSSSFPLSSCPTFSLAHLHFHLPFPLPFIPPSLSSIPFSINNNSRSLSSPLVCVGHAVSVTRVLTIPCRSRAIFLSLPLTDSFFLFFSSSLLLTLRWSSLCLAWSLLVTLTARNQYIPLHSLCPYHEPSSPTTILDPGPPTPQCSAILKHLLSFFLLLSISLSGEEGVNF